MARSLEEEMLLCFLESVISNRLIKTRQLWRGFTSDDYLMAWGLFLMLLELLNHILKISPSSRTNPKSEVTQRERFLFRFYHGVFSNQRHGV